METFMKTRKRLAAGSLMAVRSEYESEHCFEPQKGKIYNSFGYIESGSAVFRSAAGTVCAGSGDLIYIPEGLKYCSTWSGDGKIVFYSIHFRSEISGSPFWSSLALQRVAPLSGGACAEKVKKIYELCGSESFAGQLEGYSLFYSLASEAAKSMTERFSGDFPHLLTRALSFIDSGFTSIGSVSEIAEYCFISESRLYHLFKEYLNTTPVTYLNRVKILQATEMMKDSSLSLEHIASEMNFNSEYSFRKTFIRVTGTTPSDFRKNRAH